MIERHYVWDREHIRWMDRENERKSIGYIKSIYDTMEESDTDIDRDSECQI